MRNSIRVLTILVCLGGLTRLAAATNPFLGEWALTIPGGAAGWLGVQETNGHVQASVMWGWGSVEPVASAKLEDGRLILTRNHQVERTDSSGRKAKTNLTETITATVEGKKGNVIELVSVRPSDDGQREISSNFSGHRQPPLPPTPDMSKMRFGPPIELFNGKDLTGWRLTDPNAFNGWSVKDGLLVNTVVQEEGKHKSYGNLRTDREFEDFNLTLEVRLAEGGNSGVYIRGIYEVQVADTYGRPLNSHNMGAIYSRIKPTVAAEKPPGQWQTLDITFVDRHATIVLNGKKIIDDQPVAGCTGGALWSDVTRPGPIYLQGDHTGIEYRNLVLRPALK